MATGLLLGLGVERKELSRWKGTEEEPREQWEELSTPEWGPWLLFEELGKVSRRTISEEK